MVRLRAFVVLESIKVFPRPECRRSQRESRTEQARKKKFLRPSLLLFLLRRDRFLFGGFRRALRPAEQMTEHIQIYYVQKMRLNSLFKIPRAAAGAGAEGRAVVKTNDKQRKQRRRNHLRVHTRFLLTFLLVSPHSYHWRCSSRSNFIRVFRLPFAGAVIHDAYLNSGTLLRLSRL